MLETGQVELLVGRKEELGALRAAIQKRESRLIWGGADAGKTFLVSKVISGLSAAERRACICWTGAATVRHLASYFVGRLFELRDPFVRAQVRADGATETSLSRWLHKQTSLRLRNILFTASRQGRYCLFLDHFPPVTHKMARLMKELMYRCKTPVYLAARNYSQVTTGNAWSLYWNDALRVHLSALDDRDAGELLELCIRTLHLDSFDLGDFRVEILRLSGHLPGSIVKMCQLASQTPYHYGDQIKINLVHVDYLMQANRSSF